VKRIETIRLSFHFLLFAGGQIVLCFEQEAMRILIADVTFLCKWKLQIMERKEEDIELFATLSREHCSCQNVP
jgi:hypothetical protein